MDVNYSEKIETSVPESEQKQLTMTEFRKLMNQYFTVRRPFVQGCGHKIDINNQPRHRNCEYCWFAFFKEHGDLVNTADEIYKNYGMTALDQLQGRKFRVMFTRFMSTLWKLKQEMEDKKEENGTSN